MPSGRRRADASAIGPAEATAILRQHLGRRDLTVQQVRKLCGGMIHRVCEWTTDGEPASVVAKVNAPEHRTTFERELAILRWYRQHTRFPVPEPMGCFTHDAPACSGLVMQHIAGPNLADARLSPRGIRQIQRELADHVASLHEHERDTFGLALAPAGPTRWLEVFAPMITDEFAQVRDRLFSRSRDVIDRVLDQLAEWLPEPARPTLVHGDLWATNILVDDIHPDRPNILAFIDCGATFADPVYELAYLRLFQTADETFFHHYTRRHALPADFERRCRIYWLNTMMLHVRLFGERYTAACEDIAGQLTRWM